MVLNLLSGINWLVIFGICSCHVFDGDLWMKSDCYNFCRK